MGWTERRIRGSFALKLGLTAALVALGDVLFFQQGRYGGVFGLYGLALLAALAAAHPAVLRQRLSSAALVLAGCYALAMAWSPGPLAWCLFWAAAGMAILLPRFAGFDDGWRWFQRLAVHGLVALAGPLPDTVRAAKARARRRPGGGGARRVAALAALPLGGSAAFAWLFAAANPVIGRWFAGWSLPAFDGTTILRAALWLLLFWLAWGLMRAHVARRVAATWDGGGDLAIAGVTRGSVLLSLVCFNALFLLQNGMDATWLWGLLPLPEGLTLAEYAHRGAYPLVGTALLAALFVLVALRPGSAAAADPAIRRLVAAWIGQNLFLLGNAILRTVDYVQAYSLTVLRISALLWMGLVAVGLVLVGWRMLRGRSAAWLINSNLLAAGALLTAVCFVDLGAVAARWNVAHAREVDGDGARLDLCYLDRLGGSALLPLVALERRPLPADLHRRVRNVRLVVHHRLVEQVAEGGWDRLSARRLREARERLGGAIGPRRSYADTQCDGNPPPPPPPPVPPPPLPPKPVPAPALTDVAER